MSGSPADQRSPTAVTAPTASASTSPQWSLFPFPEAKMTAPPSSTRRTPIYQGPSSPLDSLTPGRHILRSPASVGQSLSSSISTVRSRKNTLGEAPLHSEKSYSIALPLSSHQLTATTDLSVREYTSDKQQMDRRRPVEPQSNMNEAPRSPSTSPRSRANSETSSYETNATSIPNSVPALQAKGEIDDEALHPLNAEELDPGSFDLVAPPQAEQKKYSLETRSEQLFSSEHLQIIFGDPSLLLRFTNFLGTHRASSLPILIYYLDAIKALKAISYANAIAESLDPVPGCGFTIGTAIPTKNEDLERKAKEAFETMVRNDLPAYITHVYIQTVSLSITRRISGTLPAHLREASEGLAEVFCLTDPSRPDNPIVFASEEFHRTTQYGMDYVIGRNCRFLQGPKTNPYSVHRLRERITAGQEHCEVFLNYRRDGSPFMNLLMTAPLCDSRGKIRYFIGAQVDVSGLVKECYDFESLKRLAIATDYENGLIGSVRRGHEGDAKKDEFQELSEMLNLQELETVRKFGGRMHKEHQEEIHENNRSGGNWNKTRLLIHGGSPPDRLRTLNTNGRPSGKLSGVYEHYLLVRPYPSLKILFASPSLRVPGILQSSFISRIGGSSRVREELTQALADGRGVTAKVRWVSKNDTEGRSRWIHCTPLIGNNGAIGVWMVVLVDDENEEISRKFRQAPPVDPRFGRSIRIKDDDEQSVTTGSLRNFAIANGGRDSTVNGLGDPRPDTSHSSRPDTASGSQYTLRID